MATKETYKAAVRTIVEFVLREGDILPGTPVISRFTEGMRGHKAVQANRGETYRAEVSVTIVVEGNHSTLEIGGRADGIEEIDGEVCIEEIKTTDISLKSIQENDFPLHWAQAMLYGYIYAHEHDLESLTIRLTYFHLQTDKTVSFDRIQTIITLTEFWNSIIPIYLEMLDNLTDFSEKRTESIDQLSFPFNTFRAGQREMAVAVYNTVRDHDRLFIQAPTGIGKTMGVLYPAIKAMRKQLVAKIFYLTAKTIGRTVAEEAVNALREGGLRIKSVTLTAKRKICFLKDAYPDQSPPCDPETCQFARGHYSRINDALSSVFQEDMITREVVERYALQHQVCPFEFSLDISSWADVVICDYNYAFDPRAQLQRFFQRGKGSYALLVDEAHNLVERGREMFSARLSKRDVLSARRIAKLSHPDLAKELSKLNSQLLELKKSRFSEDADPDKDVLLRQQDARTVAVYEENPPVELIEPVKEFIRAFEWSLKWSRSRAFPTELIDLYFTLLVYAKVADGYDEHYLSVIQATRSDLNVKLSCIDPATRIDEVLKKGSCAVFFSATLSPMNYYTALLAGTEAQVMMLPSPFPRENLCMLLESGVSTRYRDRAGTYDQIAEMIFEVATARKGNYLVFFPSYVYMEEVRLRFAQTYAGRHSIEVTTQRSGMDEEEREAFLSQFDNDNTATLVGFAVMGGIFAEGIDLKGERLVGAIVVGVGLPAIGPEREVIKNYFDDRNGRGFDYAYTFPGFNRVQQAGGRVIRTEKDRGVVLLIDDRFGESRYQELFPGEWIPPERTDGPDEIARIIEKFWS